MEYETEARNVVTWWNKQYLLEDMPRKNDAILIKNIAEAIKAERDECAAVVSEWLNLLESRSSMMNILDILQIIESTILQRGRDEQTSLPVLREHVSEPAWAEEVHDAYCR